MLHTQEKEINAMWRSGTTFMSYASLTRLHAAVCEGGRGNPPRRSEYAARVPWGAHGRGKDEACKGGGRCCAEAKPRKPVA